jgi:hypothetical protein
MPLDLVRVEMFQRRVADRIPQVLPGVLGGKNERVQLLAVPTVFARTGRQSPGLLEPGLPFAFDVPVGHRL